MLKIGLLSDTHGYLHNSIFDFFSDCNEIWHAGDWGNIVVYEKLLAFKPLRGVWGNIDGIDFRKIFSKTAMFEIGDIVVLMTHIGGYPGKYDNRIKKEIELIKPNLFISGHSHILKVMYDKKLDLLHINPGAAGKYGFHQISTAVRFEINNKRFENLEIIEISK